MAGKLSPVEELVSAKSEIVRLESELALSVSARDLAQTQAQKNFADLQAVTAERDDFKTRLETSEKTAVDLAAKNADLESKEQDLAKRTNAALQHAMATHGVPAVALGAEDAPGGKSKPDFSNLRGIEKSIAIHRSELSASKN